jgi:hypothetical protein
LHFAVDIFAHHFYLGAVEKETLSIQHQADLQKEKDETAWLEEELAEMKRQHVLELQRVADASKTELESTRKELDEVHSREVSEVQDRLQKELPAERDLRELEKKRNDALDEVKLSWAGIVEKLDRQVEGNFMHSPFFCHSYFMSAITYIRLDVFWP